MIYFILGSAGFLNKLCNEKHPNLLEPSTCKLIPVANISATENKIIFTW
jgi:hypothetical protein